MYQKYISEVILTATIAELEMLLSVSVGYTHIIEIYYFTCKLVALLENFERFYNEVAIPQKAVLVYELN